MRWLGLDYLDLYLIHWPLPDQDRYVDTWKAFERLYSDGRIRSIGVSNFHIPHLRRLLHETKVVPAVNQIELHPYLSQHELRAFHAELGIVTEAWSPLGQGKDLLGDTALTTIAARYRRSPAQVVLRWHLQVGNVAIPKSVTPSRIRENIEVTDFELSNDDVAILSTLETGRRFGPHPDELRTWPQG